MSRKASVRAATSLLIAVLLCLAAAIPTWAQQQKEWTWKDRDGKARSRADLDEILRQHKLWLDSGKKSGAHADLTGAVLERADLRGATLAGAYVRDADLFDANLSGANLGGADLMGASLLNADLSDANLSDANLSGADLSSANLNKASLIQAILSQANLPFANLRKADLSDAHLDDAHLTCADLSTANLSNADLSNADLGCADLRGAEFEPKSLPKLEAIAQAKGMELMTYINNPGPLTQLRKQFQDAAYREQERAVTCALNRREAELDSPVETWFKRLAFDWTCAYGLKPGRPLRIVGVLWLLFSAVYAVFMHRPGTSGVYFVGTRWSRGRSNTQGIQIRPRAARATKPWRVPFLWLRREWRVLRASMFSLMSAFNIGFRDINFGRWLRLLTKREYDLKAVGWARTVSGFQSLLSVYLIALWVLSYFGRPFG